MYKGGKWARQIIALQEEDGKWGCFHTLSRSYGAALTTEQALRRLERLGYTMEDECIQKAVGYMEDCLAGKSSIPDRREKLHDWDIFTSLILAAWIRRFTCDSPKANQVARQWADIINSAFAKGAYDQDEYAAAFHSILGMKPRGGKLIDFVNFYPISLMQSCLDERMECAVVDHVISRDNGIYYIYESGLSILPPVFESKNASRYLAAIELLSFYKYAVGKLDFVVDWLYKNQNADGKWDMGKAVNDKIYFPLSDDWRKKEVREADCTERIGELVSRLTDGQRETEGDAICRCI